MNTYGMLFLLISAVALMALPRRWAPLPLLLGACYMTGAQYIKLGPFHFTVLRLLLLLGVIRAMSRRETLPGGVIGLDRIMLWWGGWLVCASFFHRDVADTLVLHLGAAYNVLGIYFLIRVFCHTTDDIIQLVKLTAFLLVPVALEMVHEKLTGRNLFAFLGGVPLEVMLREGKLRAQGPFGHPILAGTAGAMCVPLMISIWHRHRVAAQVGLAACLAMVLASKSSGPIMSVAIGVFALVLWRWRHLTRRMRIAAVVAYFLLDLAASRPAYYAILNRIDLTGSSTGWHRAELIRTSIEHLDEWWFAGTDYTRHWMPVGVSWSEEHSDITNQYIFYGTWGGLPLMFLFMGALWIGFRYVGQALRLRADAPFAEQFMMWALGAGLFSHAATCITIAYFDQSVMFLYLNLAAIGSLHFSAQVSAKEEEALLPEETDSDEADLQAATV